MSKLLLIIVGIIYGVVSINLLIKGNIPMAIVFWSYAVANYGLYLVV